MQSVASVSFSIIAQIRKESVGQKVCENPPGVRMRLYVKFEGDACRM